MTWNRRPPTKDDQLAAIEALAERARAERAPEVDVAARVLGALEERREPWVLRQPFTWFTLASCAAAGAVAAVSVSVLDALSDPLWVLLQMMPMMSP
jgi:hypothetical protein